MSTPRHWAKTGEPVASDTTSEREAMTQTCQALLKAIAIEVTRSKTIPAAGRNACNKALARIAEREANFAELTNGHRQARAAIRKGIDQAQVMALFDLSETAYQQLAGQVRAGIVD